jgi:HSP20 family protein
MSEHVFALQEVGVMALMHADPFRDLDRVAQMMWGATPGRPAVLPMPLDAYKSDGDLVIEMDLPGVDPESIDLSVERGSLAVTAERQWRHGEGIEVAAAERPYGRFSRQVRLADNLDVTRAGASYDHGVLRVVIPVSEEAKPRRLRVTSADRPHEVTNAEAREPVGT